MKNLLTDIAGVRVGHAGDARLASGVTAVIFDNPAVAAVDVRGGGPGTRESAALDLENTVEQIDGIAFAGGSAFGFRGRRRRTGVARRTGPRVCGCASAIIPIVPGAICFDLSERRRQGLGPLRALSRSRLRRGRRSQRRFRARQRRRRAWRDHGQFQGRSWLGIGDDARAASASPRLRWSMRSAASRSAMGRGSGRRHLKSAANMADADCRRRSCRTC